MFLVIVTDPKNAQYIVQSGARWQYSSSEQQSSPSEPSAPFDDPMAALEETSQDSNIELESSSSSAVAVDEKIIRMNDPFASLEHGKANYDRVQTTFSEQLSGT